MAYYIRVLTPSEKIVSASDLSSSLTYGESLTVEDGNNDSWMQLFLASSSGKEIAVVERNVVGPGTPGQEELREFIEDMDGLQPTSAANWLKAYLPSVRTIYAFQILSDLTDSDWSTVGSLKGKLWNALGGIFQADGEGFSNEDGYHIVWQFSDRVSGPWWMGLLSGGAWVHFEMELSNRVQRDQFLAGQVPQGVKIAAPNET